MSAIFKYEVEPDPKPEAVPARALIALEQIKKIYDSGENEVQKRLGELDLTVGQIGCVWFPGAARVLGVTQVVGRGPHLDRARDRRQPVRVNHVAQRAVRDVDHERPARGHRSRPGRFQMMTSATGLRDERAKSPPVVYATGISAVWCHAAGMPRISAMAGWSA